MIDIKYKNIYEKFIEHYKNVHVNPWHEINEEDLNNIYNHLVQSMDIVDNYSFKYFINYIIKRLSGESDAHTKDNLVSLIPMNFKIFGDEILVNYPNELKNCELLSINGISIKNIVSEIEEIITYGTPGKRIYELEQALFNKYILFSIPSLRNADKLVFEMNTLDNKRLFKEIDKNKKYDKDELFDFDKYRYGETGSYRFLDNYLVYNHSSNQINFKEKIENAITNLKKEDLSNIDTIIIDIRGNMGGNASLNKILMDFLEENKDKKLICLTDYRVFSAGRYALRDLINLGAITIGDEISTPINCYGNCNWINIDGYYFSASECYFHPFIGFSVSSKEEFNKDATEEILKPYIFKPDILVKENKEDFINGVDTILNYAIDYNKNQKQSR